MGAPIIFSGSYGKMLNNGGIKFPDGGIWPSPTPVALGSGAIDWSLATCFTITLTANTTFTFSNQKPGQEILLYITQHASAAKTVTFPTIKTTGGTLVMSTALSAIDCFWFHYNGSFTQGAQNPGLA